MTEPEPTGPKKQDRPPDVISDKTANVIIGVVTGIWALNILVGMFGQVVGLAYEPPETINGIFMTIVGGAFVLRARARGGSE